MSSRTLPALDSVDFAVAQNADTQPLDGFDGFTAIDRAGSGDSSKSESTCEAEEMFRPVDVIPAEVYELIRNWELAHLQRHESTQAVDSMGMEVSTDPQSSNGTIEPMRLMSVAEAPPKRFYRTFWRSVMRRILRLEKERAFNRAAMSSSDVSNGSSSAGNN